MSDCNCANKSQVNKSQVDKTQVDKTQVDKTQVNKSQVNKTQVDKKDDDNNNNKYITNLNKLNKIISKYDDYTTIENFSDIDIVNNTDTDNIEFKYSYLSTLMYGPGLQIISVVEEIPTGVIIINPKTFTFDKILGNIKINTNDFEYKTFTVYGFKSQNEFLFKNTITNIMNKALPNLQ
jgi:hypothetical protein